eukprot:CAMPEP_0171084860 /NCGR_PEP_ID=MMETSP0766_2-20121228/18579_1 /TAXON_ID=439317 /ORGANISM="Gambierdiscus australes, Strain CAWD 149" /LENGTH=77 /DNA_ID=CAMNT_0011542387 /DNA_START=217 /DNA_END=450 /DNA_ORIENTATION=-
MARLTLLLYFCKFPAWRLPKSTSKAGNDDDCRKASCVRMKPPPCGTWLSEAERGSVGRSWPMLGARAPWGYPTAPSA